MLNLDNNDHDALSQNLRMLFDRSKLSLKEFSKKAGIGASRMNEYLNGDKRIGPKTATRIEHALGLKKFELLHADSDSRLSRAEVVGLFVNALDQFQRMGTSLSGLTESEYKRLFQLVGQLGGWKKAIELIERELVDAPLRQENYSRVVNKLLRDDGSKDAYASAPVFKDNSR